MEFLKKIIRGLLCSLDMVATVFAVLCVLLVFGLLVYNGMYITTLLLAATIAGVYFISKRYHSA